MRVAGPALGGRFTPGIFRETRAGMVWGRFFNFPVKSAFTEKEMGVRTGVWAMAAAFALGCGSAFAACGPVCRGQDSACPKPPKMKWIKVTETIMEKVPVQRWVEEEVEVPCIQRKMAPREVEVMVKRPVVEEVAGTTRKQVWEEEQYESCEYRDVKIECQSVKKICKKVPVCEEKKVERTVYEDVCDPCTGQMRRCPKKVVDTIQVQTYKRVIEEVPYTYTKTIKEKVPVTKTRKVCKWVEVPCTQQVTRMVPTKETTTQMEAVEETVMVKQMVRKCVTDYVEKPRCVVKRVCVPVEDPCNPCQATSAVVPAESVSTAAVPAAVVPAPLNEPAEPAA